KHRYIEGGAGDQPAAVEVAGVAPRRAAAVVRTVLLGRLHGHHAHEWRQGDFDAVLEDADVAFQIENGDVRRRLWSIELLQTAARSGARGAVRNPRHDRQD